jgi:5-formyltetrahydrofolate cyclo-ligase
MTGISDLKRKIRKQLMEARSGLDESSRSEYDAAILEGILSLKEYKEAGLILTYVSYNGEVDTFGLIYKALGEGKKVGCPVCDVSSGEPRMNFCYITSVDDLVDGYKSIREPDSDVCERVDPKDMEKALIIVPMVGYDDDGNRLGYGKGFYDRFLAANKFTASVGLAYTCQRVDMLPVDKYDIKPDFILTEIKK